MKKIEGLHYFQRVSSNPNSESEKQNKGMPF